MLTNHLKLWSLGVMLAITVTLATLLIQEGFHPAVLSLVQAAGSVLILYLWQAPKLNHRSLIHVASLQHFVQISSSVKKHWHYFFIASLLGFTIPNLIVLFSADAMGVGIASLAYALPIIFAYGVTVLIGDDKLHRYKVGTLAMISIGTLIYLYQPSLLKQGSVSWAWLVLLLIAPLSVGIANVYRGRYFPKEVPIPQVALLTNAFSVFSYLLLMPFTFEIPMMISNEHVAILIGLAGLGALSQLTLFSLQRTASPVFIGQIGSITALFGGLLGAMLFGEVIHFNTAIGAFIILLGIVSFSRLSNVRRPTGVATN